MLHTGNYELEERIRNKLRVSLFIANCVLLLKIALIISKVLTIDNASLYMFAIKSSRQVTSNYLRRFSQHLHTATKYCIYLLSRCS